VGNGFNVFPVFSSLAFSKELSPWLMFDYAAPKEFAPTTQRLGVGKHPHRGFETVTLAFQGGVEHADSAGNTDVIGPGDVQWMTAGRGIIHEEYHARAFAKSGGTFEMCQLWVNLPKADKMHAPRYQPILDADIPVVPLRQEECAAAATGSGGAEARVIAGELHGVRGPAMTFSPVELWDIKIATAGLATVLSVPEGHNCIVFVRRGAISVGAAGQERSVGPQCVALMQRSGTDIRIVASVDGTQVLLLGGEPLDEPIVAQGPFVMNTRLEIEQAIADYSAGRMGR